MSSIISVFTAATFMSMMNALLLTAYHRYMVIYEQKVYIFTKKRLFLLCLACYNPLVWAILVLLVQGFVTKMPGENNYTFALPYEMLFFGIVSAIFVSMYFVFLKRLVGYLWSNMAFLAVALQKTEQEIKREKRIVKAIVIQGLLPLFSAAPIGYSYVVISLFGSSPLETYHIPILGYNIQSLIWIFGYLNPVCDACTTFFVVKAYSDAFRATVAGWLDVLKKRCSRTVAPVQINLGNVAIENNGNRQVQTTRHQ